jgi:hypothetical protein
MRTNDIDIQDLIEKNGPFKSETISFEGLYLPSLSKVYELFGSSINFTSTVKLIEEQSNKKLNLSLSTKRNAEIKGVGIRSTEKILSWVQSLPAPTKELICKKVDSGFSRRIAAMSNSAQWLPFLKPLGTQEGVPSDILIPVLNFLYDRCDNDYNNLCSIQIKIKSGRVNTNCNKTSWKLEEPLWINASFIPEKWLKVIFSSNSNLDGDCIYQAYLSLEYDFYQQLVACIEIGSKKWINEYSYVSPALQAYTQSTEADSSIACCIGGLLSVLKDELHEYDAKTIKAANSGWRKLASFIEIKDSDSSEPLQDRQYTQLKHWRSGKDTPSKDAFEKLTKKYLEYILKPNDKKLSFCFSIMAMLDNLERTILDRTEQEYPNINNDELGFIKHQIQKVLSDYPRYYDAC